jgi:hypothetical protein
LIEEMHGEDDVKVQNSFQAYDGCSGKSKIITKARWLQFCMSSFDKTGGPDECEVAADIYQCGRNVDAAITAEIFTRSKGNATIVSSACCILLN